MSRLFTDRIIDWNAVRREPIFDYELCEKMLTEEVDELIAAKDHIEVMDAVGDIVFVAVGELWKLGMPLNVINSIFYEEDLRTIPYSDIISHAPYLVLGGYNTLKSIGQARPLELCLNSVLLTAIPFLRHIGMDHGFYDVVHAICDSNDTKDIIRVGSNVKSSKGPNFKPPTERLKVIYETLKGTKL